MYHFLLEANEAGNTLNPDFLARLGEGTRVLLQGMLTVFAVLCIIWLCLTIMRIFLYDLPKRRAERPAAKAEAPIPAAAPVSEIGAAELIAVITAAVAAYRADEEGGFRVVAFHRVKK